MDKPIMTENLHYYRRQLAHETDPIAIDVLTYHIKITAQRLEMMK